MNDAMMLTTLISGGCALAGAGLAYLALRMLHRRDLAAMFSRLEKIDRARVQSNAMLVQAKKQIEGLQKDLEETRRQRRNDLSALRDAQTAQAAAQSSLPALPVLDGQAGLAAARARLDLMLDENTAAQNGGWQDTTAPAGFAATQPLSGYGNSTLEPHRRAAA